MTTTHKTVAAGTVDLGDLTATILSALSSVSADARIGGGGVTVGFILTPSQRDIENQRVITPIPLPQEQGIGMINLAALFPRLLDQHAARTLPATERTEGLATLLRLGLVTEAESETLGSLFKKDDDGKIPKLGEVIRDIEKALGKPGITGPVTTTILNTMLVVAKREQAARDTAAGRWSTEYDWDKMFGGGLAGAGVGATIGALGGPLGAVGGALTGFVAGSLFSGGGPVTHYEP